MDIYYMSNGLTFELYYIFLRNFRDRCQMKIGSTKFHEISLEK